MCPGGTGKKLKFCCSDLITDLDKIDRMLAGEQRIAGLDYVDKMLAKHPDRACLLAIKSSLHAELEQPEKLKETLDRLLAKHPGNPIGLAELTLLHVAEHGGRASIDLLQKAIAAAGTHFPLQTAHALDEVASALVEEGELLAARGHLMFRLSIGGLDSEPVMSMLMSLNGVAGVPLTAKQITRLAPCPAGATYQRGFDAAYEAAQRGNWIAASEKFYELVSKVGDQAVIWHNLAILRGWLGDSAGAVRALRKCAALKTSLDDQVEAESLAQWLESQSALRDEVEAIKLEIPVTNHDQLATLLASDSRLQPIPGDLSRTGEEGQPPPQGVYWLIDRPMPETGVNIALGSVPTVVGELLWFGRQTDRPERLELITFRGPRGDKALASLQAALGSVLGTAGGEEVLSKMDLVQQALSADWRFPADTPEKHRAQLLSQHEMATITEIWPKLKLKVFGGKSAEEIAGDSKERVKLLAAILNLELTSNLPAVTDAARQLRSKLGLPQPEPPELSTTAINDQPITRVIRLDPQSLSSELLAAAYGRSVLFHVPAAMRAFGREVVARSDLPQGTLDKADVYALLATLERNWKDSVALLDRAREAATAAGQSTARFDLAELNLHLLRFDLENSQRLLRHLQAEHIHEPGVAYSLQNLLQSLGIFTGGQRGAAAASGPAVEAAPVAPEAAGRIWTPGGEAEATGKKSTIWTPDLD